MAGRSLVLPSSNLPTEICGYAEFWRWFQRIVDGAETEAQITWFSVPDPQIHADANFIAAALRKWLCHNYLDVYCAWPFSLDFDGSYRMLWGVGLPGKPYTNAHGELERLLLEDGQGFNRHYWGTNRFCLARDTAMSLTIGSHHAAALFGDDYVIPKGA